MSIEAILLLLFAAVLHAAWNLLLKREKEKVPVLWWALLLGSLAFLPLLAKEPHLEVGIGPFVGASAACEALYFAVLAAAYEEADFSLVYPLARGSVPALLALCSIWFLGERLSWRGASGIGLVVLGLLVLAGRAKRSGTTRASSAKGIGLALLTALFIVGYSLIDAAAVRRVPSAPYTAIVLAASAAILAPGLFWRYGWRELRTTLSRRWRSIGLIAVLLVVSYALVLQVYSVAPVIYAGAVREVSIVFAALAGALWLDEELGVRRAIGAALAFAGILVLALSR